MGGVGWLVGCVIAFGWLGCIWRFVMTFGGFGGFGGWVWLRNALRF